MLPQWQRVAEAAGKKQRTRPADQGQPRSRKLADRLSAEDIAAIVKRYERGDLSLKTVADEFGVASSSIRKVLEQQGVQRRPSGVHVGQ